MKIQFVFAPPRKMPRLGEMGERIAPPLGILYLAAYLRRHIPGLALRAIDGPRHGFGATVKQIAEFNPDVLCVSYYVVSALGAYELINELKKIKPSLLCIVGGHHVTAMPGEALKRSGADLEVYSEGEVTLAEIIREYGKTRKLEAMNLDKIEGIGYLKHGGLHITPQRPLIADLDTIPFPARDLLDMGLYDGWYISRQRPQARVIFARGCPYRCTFCSNKVWNRPGSGVRVRSAENIVDELEMLQRDYGIKEFSDDGDAFNHDVAHAIGICEEIKRRGLGMTWKCQLRCSPLPESLVKAMAESGCWYVHLGIESANQKTLNGIKKGITIKQAEKACDLLRQYGIKTLALFMLFNVWEEKGRPCYEGVAETGNTIRFAKKLLKAGTISMISAAPAQPYPGSELYDIAVRHGLLKEHLKENWDAWLKDDAYVMALPGVTEPEMAFMRLKANLVIASQMMKFRHFTARDIPFFIQKALKLVWENLKARSAKP